MKMVKLKAFMPTLAAAPTPFSDSVIEQAEL
jgi:hypothetical protein